MLVFIIFIIPAVLIIGGVSGLIWPDFMVKRYAHFTGWPARVFSCMPIFTGLAIWRFFWMLPHGPEVAAEDGPLRLLVLGIAFTLTGGVVMWILSAI